MCKETLDLYSKLQNYVGEHSFNEVLKGMSICGDMDVVLAEMDSDFLNPNVSNFCSKELYDLVQKEKLANNSSDTSIGHEVEIIDTFHKKLVSKKSDIFEHKIILFKVAENSRYLIDSERVYMVDGYYIYHEYSKNDTHFCVTYYLIDDDDDLSMDYIIGNFNYICSIAYRNNKINPKYPKKVKKPILCKKDKQIVTFSNKSECIGYSYSARVLSNCTNKHDNNITLYYVSDDNRMIRNHIFSIYNGYYLEVKNEYIYYLGNNFEYALDIRNKALDL